MKQKKYKVKVCTANHYSWIYFLFSPKIKKPYQRSADPGYGLKYYFFNFTLNARHQWHISEAAVLRLNLKLPVIREENLLRFSSLALLPEVDFPFYIRFSIYNIPVSRNSEMCFTRFRNDNFPTRLYVGYYQHLNLAVPSARLKFYCGTKNWKMINSEANAPL